MKNAIKFLFPLLLAFVTSVTFATPRQLNSFTELLDALSGGESVRVVIHYGDCTLMLDGEEVEAPDAIGGMEIGNFEYFAPGFAGMEQGWLSFSSTSLVQMKDTVYNYVKFRVYDDGRVHIVARYLKPRNYKIVMNETFLTTINNGANDGAIRFFLP